MRGLDRIPRRYDPWWIEWTGVTSVCDAARSTRGSERRQARGRVQCSSGRGACCSACTPARPVHRAGSDRSTAPMPPPDAGDGAVGRILSAPNAFAVLGLAVPAAASSPSSEQGLHPPAVVRRAYLKAALAVHPDKCTHPDAERAFKLLADAYEAAKDEAGQQVCLAESAPKPAAARPKWSGVPAHSNLERELEELQRAWDTRLAEQKAQAEARAEARRLTERSQAKAVRDAITEDWESGYVAHFFACHEYPHTSTKLRSACGEQGRQRPRG